jgi:thymidylate synthase
LIRTLSSELGVTTGEFHHTVGSLHLYEKNVDEARKVILDAV